MLKKSPQIIANKFECINCNYITNKKKDFNKHNLTNKHIAHIAHNSTILLPLIHPPFSLENNSLCHF